jgi:hypothetical protein
MRTRLIPCAVLILLAGCAAQRKASPGSPIQFLETGTPRVMSGPITAPAAFVNDLLAKTERKLIVTVDLTLEVDSTKNAGDSVVAIAVRRGGFVVSGSLSKVSVRVPTDGLEETLGQMMALGHLIDRKYTGLDITDSYRDDQIRLENALNVRKRLLQLLEKAESIQDILNVERELERINRDIDGLRGRINSASQQMEFTAVTVRFRSTIRSKPGPLGFVFYQFYKGCRWLFVR